ncbi:hypothetical protein sos41_05490 [Alphaproteobacteria bacterium SO-S41]|nr:hypothetical protein sos41_05490 [Alphaproteobacteria bacterium SO-S41]
MRRFGALAFAMAFAGCAAGSALYETTPACALLSEAEASAILGQAMTSKGGMADPGMYDCYWDGAGGIRLEFALNDAALYAPSGQTASDEFDRMIKATTAAGDAPELIDGIGERAALHRSENPAAWFLTVVAGGDYLTISLTGATRTAILTLGKTVAPRM